VLSYTNDRGWNDPPPFAFSPNNTGNRKRIDPRKRVAHNITAMNNGMLWEFSLLFYFLLCTLFPRYCTQLLRFIFK